jgi:hypothetical protein
MSWLWRFLCGFVGGMVAAVGLILIYVYLLGAPHLPRLPIIGFPGTYVALALSIVWGFIQVYLTTLGLIVDALLSAIGLREPPRGKMAFFHGVVSTAALLLLAAHYRPSAITLSVVLLVPLAAHAMVRLAAGHVPKKA